MTTQIHRISDKQPEFPCWLWHEGTWRWIRHEAFPRHDLLHNAYTHWHPDSPTAPASVPEGTAKITSETHPEIASEHREMTAPLAAPAQGKTGFPNIEAIASGTISGRFSEWPLVKPEAARLLRELNEAKTLYAASLDTLKDMSAQVAQLTGAQDRMDAEIAMLTADLFRATSERDQARQDLEERCAENDRERAAHLQAYQAAVKERDEARAELPKEAFASNVAILELQSKFTAAESELAELRKDRDMMNWLSAQSRIDYCTSYWKKTDTRTLRQAITDAMNWTAHQAARNQQENRE